MIIYDFKEISAKWELKVRHGRTKEIIDKPIIVEIKREPTGASPYGVHSVLVDGISYKYFDTRYDDIPYEKEDWLKFWQEWLNNNWCVETIKLVDYQEEVIKQEFDW